MRATGAFSTVRATLPVFFFFREIASRKGTQGRVFSCLYLPRAITACLQRQRPPVWRWDGGETRLAAIQFIGSGRSFASRPVPPEPMKCAPFAFRTLTWTPGRVPAKHNATSTTKSFIRRMLLEEGKRMWWKNEKRFCRGTGREGESSDVNWLSSEFF